MFELHPGEFLMMAAWVLGIALGIRLVMVSKGSLWACAALLAATLPGVGWIFPVVALAVHGSAHENAPNR